MVQQTSNMLNEDVYSIGDPDPDVTGLTMTGWRVLLLPVRQKNKSAGGAFIPDATINDIQSLTSLCKVLQVGAQAYSTEVYDGASWCKKGDYVLIPRTVGMKIRYNDVPLIIASDSNIQAVVENPELLDKHKYGNA